jgi:hypothetical protein
VESGYFSGYWPYNTTYWTNGLVAYTTKGNGVYNGYYGKHGGYLTAGQGIDIDALANGRADIGSYTLTWSGYSVPNGFNSAQGEVTASTNSWMGGGSGEQFSAYWSPNYGGNWYLWGYNTDCNNSPYWVSQSNGHTWSNGGY